MRGRDGENQIEPEPDDVAPALRTAGGGSDKAFVATVEAQAFKPSHYTRGKDGAPSDVYPALSADADKVDQDPVVFSIMPMNSGTDYKARPVDVAQPVLAGGPGGGNQGGDYVVATAVRRLMPSECNVLQGFKPDHTAVIYRGSPAADGPQYAAIGNSWPVPMIRWTLKRIKAHVEGRL